METQTTANQDYEYGTVDFEGVTYILTRQPEYTSRLFDTRINYNDVAEGEEYCFEMSAPAVVAGAIDEDGEPVEATVYWRFWQVKGERVELDEYDYSKPHSVDVY